VIQAGTFIIPASQSIGGLIDLGIMFNDSIGALLGFGSYNIYGQILIEADPDMFPDYEYNQGMIAMSSPGGGQGMMARQSYDEPGMVSRAAAGTVTPGQVNLCVGQTAILVYENNNGSSPEADIEWHISHKNDLTATKLSTYKPSRSARIKGVSARAVTVYAEINGRKASNDVYVPVYAKTNSVSEVIAESNSKKIYSRPGGDALNLEVSRVYSVLGETKQGILGTQYYYISYSVTTINAGFRTFNRFVKKSDVVAADIMLYGNGGGYREYPRGEPNCAGYILFNAKDITTDAFVSAQ